MKLRPRISPLMADQSAVDMKVAISPSQVSPPTSHTIRPSVAMVSNTMRAVRVRHRASVPPTLLQTMTGVPMTRRASDGTGNWNRAGRKSGGPRRLRFDTAPNELRATEHDTPVRVASIQCFEQRHADCRGDRKPFMPGACECECHDQPPSPPSLPLTGGKQP
jgi:hypothetical protein